MIRRTIFAVLALTTAIAAAEGPHAGHPQRTVLLDNERVQPDSLTMAPDEVLVFENHSLHPMRVVFTEPADSAARVRCGLLAEPQAKRAPWGLFDVDDGKLTGVIPPGRFGSLCALQPGKYAYTASRQDAQGHSDAELPIKGQVTVQ